MTMMTKRLLSMNEPVARSASSLSGDLTPAVVVAGGPAPEALADRTGAAFKAMIPVAGQPLLRRTLRRLVCAPSLGQIVTVAPTAAAAVVESFGDRIRWLESGDSLVENLFRGLHALPDGSFVLVASGDLPLLDPEEVDAFVSRARDTNAEFVYSLIPKEVCEEAFPGMKRTCVSLRDGVFTGGNLMLVHKDTMLRNADMIRESFAARKKPLVLGRMLGWGFLLRLLCHRLTVAQAVARGGELLHCRAAAVPAGPSTSFDIDKPSDLELAEQLLQGVDHGPAA